MIGLDAGGAQCRLSVTLLCPTLRIVPRKQSSRLGSCESSWTAYCRFAELLREPPDLTICDSLPAFAGSTYSYTAQHASFESSGLQGRWLPGHFQCSCKVCWMIARVLLALLQFGIVLQETSECK